MNATQTQSPTEPTVAQKAATLSGLTARVTLLNGLTEEVWVKQLPLRQMPDFAAAVDNPAALIRLCTGKEYDWLDKLAPDSFEELAIKCDEVNADFFTRWVSLAQRRGVRLAGLLEKAGVAVQAPPNITTLPRQS